MNELVCCRTRDFRTGRASRLSGPRIRAGVPAFFRAAAVAMRRILVDYARAKKAAKRGGERLRADLNPQQLPSRIVKRDVEAIDAALEQLAVTQPRIVELVQLRYFVGLTIPEAAAVLDIAPRTADAWWAYARGWLSEALKK